MLLWRVFISNNERERSRRDDENENNEGARPRPNATQRDIQSKRRTSYKQKERRTVHEPRRAPYTAQHSVTTNHAPRTMHSATLCYIPFHYKTYCVLVGCQKIRAHIIAALGIDIVNWRIIEAVGPPWRCITRVMNLDDLAALVYIRLKCSVHLPLSCNTSPR